MMISRHRYGPSGVYDFLIFLFDARADNTKNLYCASGLGAVCPKGS